MDFRFQAYGERGYLLGEFDPALLFELERALQSNPPEGYQEYVIGYRNVLILFDRLPDEAVFAQWLAGIEAGDRQARVGGRRHEVPVVYDGPDLKSVAQATGLDVDAVVAIHSAPIYRVRMMGFSPGFPYLDGLDPRLHLERKASPRDHIVPGAVAIGGRHAGIYSVASPGGWHILGRTELALFQPEKAKAESVDPREVFALAPGDEVKFKNAERAGS